jgi:homogentisate 1,2-dioxygenase
MNYLYRNSHFDELLYVQSGKGDFSSNFGNLKLVPGDYLMIPRGVIWKMDVKDSIRCLLIESKGPIEIPEKYRNRFGQLMEHSPFCERDIVTPTFQKPISKSNVKLKIRLQDGIQNYTLKNHPFDLIGWDGFYYPWKFNINDFEPITGSIHQPPPIHQTFQGMGFVVCSFVSRLFDYHKDAIPSPYPHSNVDSDEVIFYSMGEFMSREGIENESITLHPSGITHGPQPGKYEGSIGKIKTEELAVMIDTFKPLNIATGLHRIEDKKYWSSWIK